MSTDKWVAPERLSDDGVLSQTAIRQWRENGFALVDNLLPRDTLEALHEDATSFYPRAGSRAAAEFKDFGSGQRFVFPSEYSACNDITLHPNLLQAVAALLGVSVMDIRLTQSDLWPKYGRESSADVKLARDNDDQRIHVDYPNHTLVHPPPWTRPEAVEIIIFLGDVADSGGPTAVVPRDGDDDPLYPYPIINTPGVAGMKYVNHRAAAERYLNEEAPEVARFREQLYAREVKTSYGFGSVLLYRHDTWHRGTPVNSGKQRLVQNLTFKLARSHWISVLHPGWSWAMYREAQTMENLIATSTVEQRTVLGFPPPGDDYWCEQTLAAVAARYSAYGMDLTPYKEAFYAQA